MEDAQQLSGGLVRIRADMRGEHTKYRDTASQVHAPDMLPAQLSRAIGITGGRCHRGLVQAWSEPPVQVSSLITSRL